MEKKDLTKVAFPIIPRDLSNSSPNFFLLLLNAVYNIQNTTGKLQFRFCPQKVTHATNYDRSPKAQMVYQAHIGLIFEEPEENPGNCKG